MWALLQGLGRFILGSDISLGYTAARRTHEIGIRMALGATTGSALRLVLRKGLTLTFIGVVIGLALGVGHRAPAEQHVV